MSDPAPTPGHPVLDLILVATTDCPACGKKYAAHFDRCIHCGRSLPTRLASLDDAAVSVQTFDKKDISASLALALSVVRRVSA